MWEKLAARSAHLLFYGFMIVMPLTGWLMSSAAGLQVSFFGLFLLPNLIGPDPSVMHLLKEVHQWLGYSLIALIGLHSAAALKHHFINKDDVLRRMVS
jgi:cytochrome b561